MNLDAYLRRIGHTEPVKPNLETLTALHQAHLLAIPYENLDIHLGRYLPLDMSHIFDKIVNDQRGGWCYEMNGLFAWALREIGFSVDMLASGVDRQTRSIKADGNHLILLVKLDRPYLVDVGFGNGILAPIPLEEGFYQQGFRRFHLTRDGERWYFHNHPLDDQTGTNLQGDGFGFFLKPHAFSDFNEKCHELQTSPESGFVRVTVCHRFTSHGTISLRGAILKTVTVEGSSECVIESQDSYQETLQNQFGLTNPEIVSLWPKVWARHLEFVATNR